MKKLAPFILLIPLMFLFSCKKKGSVDIQYLDYWIKNNTAPYEVQFYFDVHYQPSEITYNWDFGDGTVSSEKEPVHVYANKGLYTVKLTITNYKTVVEKSLTIDVSKDTMPIKVDFDYESTHNNYYAPCEIRFYNKTQYASDFFWNFGDATGSDEIEPTHIFQNDTTYNVALYAYSGGDTATSVMQIPIASPPNTIDIDVVSVWLPEELLGRDYELFYYTENMNETPTGLDPVYGDSRPFGWIIEEPLTYFNGDYNDDYLYFEVWDLHNNQAPVYDFGIQFKKIQEQYYPDTLYWDDGNGFAAAVALSYSNSDKK